VGITHPAFSSVSVRTDENPISSRSADTSFDSDELGGCTVSYKVNLQELGVRHSCITVLGHSDSDLLAGQQSFAEKSDQVQGMMHIHKTAVRFVLFANSASVKGWIKTLLHLKDAWNRLSEGC
jgi:hypothetical protein